jgi:two-component system response regulator YesN
VRSRVDDLRLEKAIGEWRRHSAEARLNQAAKTPAQVVRAASYIHLHLFDPGLNAARVRAGCGVRNHNLTTLFHQALGSTLRDYIETLRLEAAAHLLRTLPLDAFWIAAAVGYESYETFCRAFRRHFHCTPGELRKRRAE